MHKTLTILFALYGVSLVSSIAGMELFSILILLIAIAAGVLRFTRPELAPFRLQRLGPDTALWAYWALIVVGGFVSAMAPRDFSTFEVVREGRWILNFYALTAALYFLREKQTRFLPFMASITIILSLYTYMQVFTGLDLIRTMGPASEFSSGWALWRARGFFNNTMSYSYTIGVILCFLFAGVLTSHYQRRNRALVAAAAVLLGLSLVLTFTRGAWVAAFVAIGTLFFLKSWRLGVKMLLGFTLVVGLASAVAPPIRERIYSIYKEKEKAKSTRQRYELWSANWAMFKEHPLIGVGYGQNSSFVQEYNRKLLGRDGFVENAHNNVLQMLGGGGIFVFLFWLYFSGWFFISAVRLWLSQRGRGSWAEVVAMGSIGAQIFFHVGGITQATFFDSEPMHIFVFAWALLVSQILAQKTSPTSSLSTSSSQR